MAVENTVVTSTDIIKNSGAGARATTTSTKTAYTIDPSVLGNDVVSVEYRSTNESVVLEGMRDRRKVLPGESAGTEYLSSITVGGPNATLPDLYQLDLRVSVPADGCRSKRQTRHITSSQMQAYTMKIVSDRTRVSRSSAPAPRNSRPEHSEITATFADGSTQTHVYRIVPVENFEELWWKDNAAFQAALDDENVDYEPLQLFALQQVE
ncbi:MAG: hypothetical protein ACLTSX_01750 [Collinsella sp.]